MSSLSLSLCVPISHLPLYLSILNTGSSLFNASFRPFDEGQANIHCTLVPYYLVPYNENAFVLCFVISVNLKSWKSFPHVEELARIFGQFLCENKKPIVKLAKQTTMAPYCLLLSTVPRKPIETSRCV